MMENSFCMTMEWLVRLDNETRLRLIRLYLALVEKNPPRIVNAMNDL